MLAEFRGQRPGQGYQRPRRMNQQWLGEARTLEVFAAGRRPGPDCVAFLLVLVIVLGLWLSHQYG